MSQATIEGLAMSVVRQLPLLALVMLIATSALAGEARPKPGNTLKLPISAGEVAADVAGKKPLKIAPLVEEFVGPANTPAQRQTIADIFSTPSNELRPTWKVRGWFSPDGSVTRLEDMGLPVDTRNLDSWRFDALVIRTF